MGDVHDGKPRREFRWSKAARDVVRADMNAAGNELSSLLTKLEEESGNPRSIDFSRRLAALTRRLVFSCGAE